MIKIALFNQKGGVGKSAATVNLAGCLEREFNKKVLVMDCDAQQNSSLHLLNVRPENTIRKILDGQTTLDKCIYPVEVDVGKKHITTNISVLPSGMDIDLLGPSDPKAYKKLTDELEEQFDYCLIDCPPQKMATAITSLCACDYVLVPIWTETDESVQGWDMVLDLINQLKSNRMNETIEIIGLLITRTNQTHSLDVQLTNFYKNTFGDYLFTSMIREGQPIRDSYVYRKPLIYYKRTSNVSKDYIAATSELIKRIEAKHRKVGK